MTWNHRVVRRVYPDAAKSEEVLYSIHECYYDENGKLDMMTEDGIDPVGDDLEGLRWTLEHMLAALDKPVVDYETREDLPSARRPRRRRPKPSDILKKKL
jgi:hypothetical protein